MKTQSQQYRQGDVFIERVTAFPKKLKKVAREGGRLVLAHGATTGHSHAIADAHCTMATSAEEPGRQYLEVKKKAAALTHDEHDTIKLPPGKYLVTRQSEYSREMVRTVED